MVVIGGTADSGAAINSIEYYNLATRPSAWTTDGK